MSLCQAGRAKDDVVVARHAERPAHARSYKAAHRAAGAVGPDKIGTAQLGLFAVAGDTGPDGYTFIILTGVYELGAEPQLHRGEGFRMGAQYLFELVLRDPLAMLGIERVARGCAIRGVRDARQEMTAQTLRRDVRRIIDPEWRNFRQRVGDPHRRMGAGSGIGGLGAWRRSLCRGAR